MAINPPLVPKTKNKSSPLIVMASVAVLLGLVAAFGIWQYLSQTQKKVREVTATRAVVIAAKQITAGTKLTDEFLAIKQLPIQTIPKDYPKSFSEIKDRIVKNTIEKDEIINESRLVNKTGGGLSVVIPPGCRAITVKVNEVIGIGGFITPGSYVDIVSTYEKNAKETFSKTILQNVLVIAAGDRIYDPNVVADPQPKIVNQVTIALKPNDAEKLALASGIGNLQLVLRPFGENVTPVTTGATLEDVYGFLAMKSDQSNVLPVSLSDSSGDSFNKAPRNAIEIILGDERSYFYY